MAQPNANKTPPNGSPAIAKPAPEPLAESPPSVPYDAPPRPCRYSKYEYCKNPAEPGYKSCRPCRTKRSAMQYAKRHRRLAAGLCVYNGCPQPPGPKAGLCPEHHAAALERPRRRRERHKAAGLCFQCGRRPPLHGYSLCWPCRVKHQESKEKAKEKKKTQAQA